LKIGQVPMSENENFPPEPTKKLVLTIVVHGIWADDLPESAAIWAENDDPTPRDYLNVVLEEWMREDIGVTLVSLPGDKCMNDDFVVSAHDATIIGAAVTDAKGWRS
jgi:hypothetical protein